MKTKRNDLLWLILHHAVRVRYSLKSWGYINNDKCAVCDRVETIEHCFLECHRVVRVWGHFLPLLSRLGDSTFSVSVCVVFYPLSDAPSRPILCYLVATILYWVWYARNLATFCNSSLSSKAITNLIIKDIKLRI